MFKASVVSPSLGVRTDCQATPYTIKGIEEYKETIWFSLDISEESFTICPSHPSVYSPVLNMFSVFMHYGIR